MQLVATAQPAKAIVISTRHKTTARSSVISINRIVIAMHRIVGGGMEWVIKNAPQIPDKGTVTIIETGLTIPSSKGPATHTKATIMALRWLEVVSGSVMAGKVNVGQSPENRWPCIP